ncbi:hypothetical protein COEREDRAFT_79027 [Coemansia reversa NRRL 1564]|uniref:Uncharacterized protein n=1 Tax=Coemansia reversa (strain ATCC 12441 / NRRL 1564) TaxID=763665 RepID=A0A2G5BL69_COERN|nr:hypothetical protein COEREDRAFT_79027 [Coemansia reversa NRRL 1564]|eukprot:PIA19750.1 hypothetical protein COEREDRAFT_79027 [Coemansia reversa NRRL 1564]
MKSFAVASIIAYSAVLAKLAAGHTSFITPCPRYSPVGENCPALPAGESLDTGDKGINAPIGSVQLGGNMPLCRHTTPWPTPAASWTAGEEVTIKFNPSSAIHSGGHCQFSISYDNGKTFAVIHEELRYCFLGSKPSGLTNTPSISEYKIKLPKDLPNSDKAVFAWTWVNASGNREFYMNCADVEIKGGSSSSYSGKAVTIANYPNYPTIPEFNGDYETGIKYYEDAKNITVSPSGGSSSGSEGSSAAYVASSDSSDKTSAAASDSASAATSDNASAAPSAADTSAATSDSASAAYSVAPSASSAPASTTQQAYDASTTPADAPESGSAAETEANSVSPNAHAAESAVESSAAVDEASGSSCADGLMRCSGDGYQICVSGQWSDSYSCGVGTVCRGTEGHIFCDFVGSTAA